MNVLRIALLALACSAPLAASAQWMWLDKDGRKVFSDRAPPPEVAPDRILRQPGVRQAAAPEAAATPAPAPAAPAPAPAAPVAAQPAAPQLAGRDPALEEKRKQAEAAEAQKKKEQEQKLAQVQADNCKRARAGKADLSSGMRVARTNDKGEREIMDDQQKAAEIQHLDTVIARDCKGPQAVSLQ